jgi:hypothetical protein
MRLFDRKRGRLAFTISLVIFLGVCVVPASAKHLPCSDLRTAKAARLISILKDYSHGTGCYSEDEDNPKECDWKVTVDVDRKLSDDRRLVEVGREQMSGPHGWSDILVFGCRSGKVAVVFENESRGDDIKEASDDKLVFGGPKWADKDAQCCPSLEERKVYVWNKKDQKYVLDSNTSTPLPKP